MDPISIGLGAIQGLSALGGLLGGNAAKRRAEQSRQQALNDLSAQLDTDYNNTVGANRHSLLAATGAGGDAITALGRNLGSNLAGAGVYNSSATAGAITQATGQEQSALGNLAAQNFYGEQSLLNQNRRYLTSQKLNLANQQYGEAQSNLGDARNGLSSFLGSLSQFNLARSGANQTQNALPRIGGGYGSGSVLDPGAGLSAGSPSGSFNGGAFTDLAGLTRSFLRGQNQPQQFSLGGYQPSGY